MRRQSESIVSYLNKYDKFLKRCSVIGRLIITWFQPSLLYKFLYKTSSCPF